MNPGVFAGFGSRPGTDGRVFVLTESNPAFPIPHWAQGGKGLVLVTGCGAGGGGRTTTGGYGGSGAWANRFPLLIPAGAASMSCAIGVAGDPGVAGGNTTLSINGTELLSLGGGNTGETGVMRLSSAARWMLLVTTAGGGDTGGGVNVAPSYPQPGPGRGLRSVTSIPPSHASAWMTLVTTPFSTSAKMRAIRSPR